MLRNGAAGKRQRDLDKARDPGRRFQVADVRLHGCQDTPLAPGRRCSEHLSKRIDLNRDRASKLKDLQDSCDPKSTRKEDEADAIAVEE